MSQCHLPPGAMVRAPAWGSTEWKEKLNSFLMALTSTLPAVNLIIGDILSTPLDCAKLELRSWNRALCPEKLTQGLEEDFLGNSSSSPEGSIYGCNTRCCDLWSQPGNSLTELCLVLPGSPHTQPPCLLACRGSSRAPPCLSFCLSQVCFPFPSQTLQLGFLHLEPVPSSY